MGSWVSLLLELGLPCPLSLLGLLRQQLLLLLNGLLGLLKITGPFSSQTRSSNELRRSRACNLNSISCWSSCAFGPIGPERF